MPSRFFLTLSQKWLYFQENREIFVNSLFSFVYCDVFVRFPQFDFMQLCVIGETGPHFSPDEDSDILGCWDTVLKPANVFVDVFMVQRPHHLGGQDSFEVGNVHDHPCDGVGPSFNRDLDVVVVPVAVRVVALAEKSYVLFVS